ncbi:MAG TPA: replication-relaxation family protein [Solirubrobacteraceae bacterium]|jgi:AcrR family transcriptional regulator|nr:replication-relaxation family protein [Solirubrobacteraceae bacterium]
MRIPAGEESDVREGRVAEFRRERIVAAMVGVVYERGYAGASVSSVSARAKVSRHTFYELFDGLDDCFLAVLERGYRQVRGLISQAFEREDSWPDGVRGALAALLAFFDSEPVLAHVLLVEAAAAGSWARSRRERHLAALTSLIEDRWGAPADGHPHPLVPAGVMASLLGVLHTHLVTGREQPLVTLLGSLMGLVTAPYLDQRDVTREIDRAEILARELLARDTREHSHVHPTTTIITTTAIEIPNLLLDPRAHRARGSLHHLAEHPGASNRQIAKAVGIARDDQISTILARLARIGLLVKSSPRPGGPNAWSLTPHGLQVATALQDNPPARQPGRTATDAHHPPDDTHGLGIQTSHKYCVKP